ASGHDRLRRRPHPFMSITGFADTTHHHFTTPAAPSASLSRTNRERRPPADGYRERDDGNERKGDDRNESDRPGCEPFRIYGTLGSGGSLGFNHAGGRSDAPGHVRSWHCARPYR